MITCLKTNSLKPRQLLNLSHQLTPDDIPSSYISAMKQPHWRTAMLDKFNALISQQTWSLVPSPPNHNIVNSK